jgi:hypothetical protein
MRIVLALVILSPLVAAGAPLDPRTAIMGEWRRPYENQALRFTPDGKCMVAGKGDWTKPAARATCSIKGDLLTFTNTDGLCATPTDQRVATYKVVVGKDTLHFELVGKDACLRRSTIDGNTWVRIDRSRPWDAPLKEMDQLKFMVGNWACETRTKGQDSVDKSRATIEPDWSGSWQLLRDEIAEGGKVVDGAHGSWGYDALGRQFVRFFTMPKGRWDMATSPGFVGDRMVWTGEAQGQDHFKFRHTFIKKSEQKIEAVFEIIDGKPYDVGSTSTETCTRE